MSDGVSEEQEHQTWLEAELAEAQRVLQRLEEEHAALGAQLREEPGEAARAERRRVGQAKSEAESRVQSAQAGLTLLRLQGTPFGLIADDDEVIGLIAVDVPKGSSSTQRARLIAEDLSDQLTGAAQSMGVVLGASADRYTRERPGRDRAGRMVLDVVGRVEGDVLVPATSFTRKAAHR
ncbi:hypothetical protein [Chondromyces apiculatus]|uniref:Uncharacterized protein n=1 Tax=Chondromyces apiculatus DSM 436 TaxID=1192034 RepID=A0A017T9X7_9BACT|nr:hypothetical protein [Chondromyces apiculatus]EYF06058.1 Hypothetical protein CAP_2248 [Chondromyces apiculatus DSM 436]